jgi:NAD(P) transhydrogenase
VRRGRGRPPVQRDASGKIAAVLDEFLALVADTAGKLLPDIQVVGEGAAELVAMGPMALIADREIDVLIVNAFYFPTLAEAYREAALDIAYHRQNLPRLPS